MDGIELLSRLRCESEVNVILLTAKTDETDKIIGLSAGADDVVTKPFSPRELTACAKAALRRIQAGTGSGSEMSVLSFRHLRMDVGTHTVTVDENSIELTVIEFDLLKALAENRGRVVTREQLLEKVWSGAGEATHSIKIAGAEISLRQLFYYSTINFPRNIPIWH